MPSARAERPTRGHLQAQINALTAIVEAVIQNVPDAPSAPDLADIVRSMPFYSADTRAFAGFLLLRMGGAYH